MRTMRGAGLMRVLAHLAITIQVADTAHRLLFVPFFVEAGLAPCSGTRCRETS